MNSVHSTALVARPRHVFTVAWLALVAVGACGGGAKPAASDGAAGNAGRDALDAVDAPAADTPIDRDDATTDAPAADATDSARDDRVDAPRFGDGISIAPDLQGGWYATALPAQDGGATVHRRLRFDGDTYYLVVSSSLSYCAETGSFEASSTQITFHPARSAGSTGCPTPADRSEMASSDPQSLSLGPSGASIGYARIRAVPKMFATVEVHDGNFAGDATLPGLFAVDKADAFCNGSMARPDGASYKALFVDGFRRTAIPAHDWVLAPSTTYYQADGVLNVLTSDTAGLANIYSHHPVEGDALPTLLAWTGVGFDFLGTETCRGWSSNSGSDTAALGEPAGTRPFASVGGLCNQTYALICIASPIPDGSVPGSPDGGAAADAGAAGDSFLQGSWSSADATDGGPRQQLRLRFDADRYYLVEEAGMYCGEVGQYAATATTITLTPQRIEGYGACTIGMQRVVPLVRGSATIDLTDGGQPHHFVRQADVPKVFATFEAHSGNFAGDATLAGADAITKADAFCNRSSAKPDAHTYKAVLVDGTTRSAKPALGWVLQPSTLYYHGAGLLAVFQTDATGLPMTGTTQSGVIQDVPSFNYMWTGLNFDYTVSTGTCNRWASADPSLSATMTDPVNGTLSTAVSGLCDVLSYGIVCAGQP